MNVSFNRIALMYIYIKINFSLAHLSFSGRPRRQRAIIDINPAVAHWVGFYWRMIFIEILSVIIQAVTGTVIITGSLSFPSGHMLAHRGAEFI